MKQTDSELMTNSNIFTIIKNDLTSIINDIYRDFSVPAFVVEPCKNPQHGDIATNIAMVSCKYLHRSAKNVADDLLPAIEKLHYVKNAQIMGAGFINIVCHDAFWLQQLLIMQTKNINYGDQNIGNGEKVIVEYVSSNPTGPMHVGHVRGGVFGDALARLLSSVGYNVTKEFYINDAGGQIDTIAQSLYIRYRQLFGLDLGDLPAGLYPAQYVIDAAEIVKKTDGDKWINIADYVWLPIFREKAIALMMEQIKDDLRGLDIHHDNFVSEKSLQNNVAPTIERLKAIGHVGMGTLPAPKGQEQEHWTPREQLLFFSTRFGDDIDRALQKENGEWTYFSGDLAYHADKISRGAKKLINVLGADHGGYVKRLNAAVMALSDNTVTLDVKLCQMVSLQQNGQELKMSKRAGTFITARDVLDLVGRDVLRIIMLSRHNDAGLDFDVEKVNEHSKDNPVFYIQYALARTCSILRNSLSVLSITETQRDDLMKNADLAKLSVHDITLIKQLSLWPRTIELSAIHHEPHRIVFYLMDLSSAFHHLWHLGSSDHALRFIASEDMPLTAARLVLVQAVNSVIKSAFNILGVTAKEEM